MKEQLILKRKEVIKRSIPILAWMMFFLIVTTITFFKSYPLLALSSIFFILIIGGIRIAFTFTPAFLPVSRRAIIAVDVIGLILAIIACSYYSILMFFGVEYEQSDILNNYVLWSSLLLFLQMMSEPHSLLLANVKDEHIIKFWRIFSFAMITLFCSIYLLMFFSDFVITLGETSASVSDFHFNSLFPALPPILAFLGGGLIVLLYNQFTNDKIPTIQIDRTEYLEYLKTIQKNQRR
ncbi:hypothetical protein EZS27_017617 [termite gut metagenome]|uniref:Uncharacterized protein n=1 Tax=termite gut metagenome TaxID=433724 RepID=A0A5J4RLL7_9ZZZZ